jgi:hypothetical protein
MVGLWCFFMTWGPAEARACDVSDWQVVRLEGECLEMRSQDGGPGVVNLCVETLTVTAEECPGDCPDPFVMDPSDERRLPLPDSPQNGDQLRLTTSAGDVLTLEYVGNDCSSERGCSVGRSHANASRSGIALLLLIAGLVGRRWR